MVQFRRCIPYLKLVEVSLVLGNAFRLLDYNVIVVGINYLATVCMHSHI